MSTRTPNLTTDVTPPSSPVPNDLWYDTGSGFLFIYYDDGNTKQWVVTNPGKGGTQGPPGPPGPVGPAAIGGTGISVSGATVAVADTAPIGTAAQTLNDVYAVATLADLRALQSRPSIVAVQFAEAGRYTGGGLFRWVAGGSSTDDGGTIIVPAGAGGFYRRVWTGPVLLDWWPLASVTDHTPFVTAALVYGMDVECPSNGSITVSTIIMTYPGQALRLNSCTITGKVGAFNYMIRLDGVGTKVLGPGTLDFRPGSYSDAVGMRADNTEFLDVVSIGQTFLPRTPYSGTSQTMVPFRHVSINDGTNSKMISGCKIKRCKAYGGRNGYFAIGFKDSEITECWGYGQPGLAFNYSGGGLPILNSRIQNNTAISSGYYGHSFSNELASAPAAGFGVPHSDIVVTGIVSRHCAFTSNYGWAGLAGNQGKMGADWTTSDQQRTHIEMDAYNNYNGGMEIKRTTTVPGIVPPAFNSISAKINCWHALDFGQGVVPCVGGNNSNATDFSNVVIDLNCWYIGCPAWTSGQYYEIWSPSKSNGWNWLCIGDVNGNPGFAGGTAGGGSGTPPNTVSGNIGAALTSTSGVTAASQNQVVVASATGIVVGATVIVGLQAAPFNVIPDGAKVTAVAGTTITLDSNFTTAVPAGSVISFNTEFFDGGLYWRAFQAIPTSPVTSLPMVNGNVCIGCWTIGTDGLTLTGNIHGTRFGVLIAGDTANDKTVSNMMIKGLRVRKVGTAVACQSLSGGGTIGVDIFNCDLEADGDQNGSNDVIHFQSNGTYKCRIYGGRIYGGPAGTSNQGIRTLSSQSMTLTLEIDGGAYIEAPNPILIQAGSTYTIEIRDATIAGGNLISVDGSGSLQVFPQARMKSTINVPGVVQTGGSITINVQNFRSDIVTAAGTAPAAGIRAWPGEWMLCNPPSATVRGYYCSAANVGTNTYTWTAFQ